MSKELRFEGKVAIITGAGNGLGRSHALLLASRGAKVVVNDLGGGAFGEGKSASAADKVVEEIKAAGGEAVANYDSVEEGGKIVQSALDHFKRLDIVVNNAGILRDTTFHKMTQQDWDLIYKVHVLGSFKVTHAAWPHLRDQGYGRILFTASAAGLYGNFGQANYGMAKLGLLGLSNTLAVEGKKRGVLVNTIAPIAGSRLTETILPKEIVDALKPEYVSPLVAWLCHERCQETGAVFEVGGGYFGKLRWERTVGKTFRVGRPITVENVERAWPAITDFSKSTHPENLQASMEPVMTNIQAGPSKGGNEFIDVDQALGYEFPPMTSKYDERDLAIYALGVGAGHDPLDDKELRTVYELHGQGFLPLPTFAVVPCLNALIQNAREGKAAPGLNYGLDRLLHGEQYTEIRCPLPPSAKLTHKAKIKNIWDKGKNAVVVTEVRSYDESGEELMVNELASVIRGAGGWGGDRGPTGDAAAPPERAPDATIAQKTDESQALLYRLSGDWNPLHADPSFASAFGFSKPILHGLCTFGFAGRHVINGMCKGDPRYFKSIKARFAESVYPGETIVTEMWRDGDERVLFRCKVKERDKVVLTGGVVELFKEIPKKKEKPKAEAAPAQAPSSAVSSKVPEATSGDVFIAIVDHVQRHPELAKKVNTIFQFRLSEPESAWVIDLKNEPGKVFQGIAEKADVTLELSDADFFGMASGSLDAQKLYFSGKLKISGNVIASQKLQFLKEVDPEQAKKAVLAAKQSGGEKKDAKAEKKPEGGKAPKGPAIAALLQERIRSNPDLAKEVHAIVTVKTTSPDQEYVFALGDAAASKVTLTLADEDFAALATGAETAKRLYQSGRMRVDGDVTVVVNRLGFLKVTAAEITQQSKGA